MCRLIDFQNSSSFLCCKYPLSFIAFCKKLIEMFIAGPTYPLRGTIRTMSAETSAR